MAKGYATRRYQLTINNPQEHGYDHNVIKAALEKGAKLLYWCMADEVGQEETYHIHLFLVYENPVMFTTLKNKFPTAHIEVPQWGKNSENYAYIRKEGAKYNKDANGHYKYTDSKGKVHEGMLDSVVHELNHRRTEFSIAGCANLEEYVQTTGEELHRIVVILDETSMILDTTGRDKDGKAVVASITNKLLAIGRLGRALGIHLLVATQRPDVGSVPGSLKAQLDGRICGHTADAQSSIVILDDGSAAKLPAIPGRFIIRNGSGSDEIIQAYYYHQ